MFTFTTLASGSLGNAALVSCGDTHILLDAGISAKRLTAGLAELGVKPHQLSAILLTHEHSDHVSGLRVFTKKAGAPIYATPPTCREWYRKNQCDQVKDLFQPLEAGAGTQIGALWVESFPTMFHQRRMLSTANAPHPRAGPPGGGGLQPAGV